MCGILKSGASGIRLFRRQIPSPLSRRKRQTRSRRPDTSFFLITKQRLRCMQKRPEGSKNLSGRFFCAEEHHVPFGGPLLLPPCGAGGTARPPPPTERLLQRSPCFHGVKLPISTAERPAMTVPYYAGFHILGQLRNSNKSRSKAENGRNEGRSCGTREVR